MNQPELDLRWAGDAAEDAEHELELLYRAYIEAQRAYFAARAERHVAGPCGCSVRRSEPGPWHERQCEIWIPFTPASLDNEEHSND